MNDHQVLPYCVQVYWEEAWCLSWCECCGCAMAFSAACQRHTMVQYCSGSGCTNKLYCRCFLHWQEANEVILCGYTRWHWKAYYCSSCIVLFPLQVGCHITSRTKEQWATVVNSLQNKSRYKCGSCSTCQEFTHRCHTTQFIVACLSNFWEICIHSNVKPNFFTNCLRWNWAFPIVNEVDRLWRCLLLLEVTSMSFVLLTLSLSMFTDAKVWHHLCM